MGCGIMSVLRNVITWLVLCTLQVHVESTWADLQICIRTLSPCYWLIYGSPGMQLQLHLQTSH